MKISAPTLTPLLRSDTQGLMLAALYLDPMREFTLSELALVSKTSVASVMRDVDRLVEAEYLLERRVGRSRLVHVNDDHRLTRSVKELVLYSYGPQVVIHRIIEGVTGISEVHIFGSWARRLNGLAGPDPKDVDVALVGKMSMRELTELSTEASIQIGREVNMQVVSEAEWRQPSTSFWKTVKEGDLVQIEFAPRD